MRENYIDSFLKFSLELPRERFNSYINSIPKAQHLNSKFINKVFLKPVESSGVMNQVQIDLVDMSYSPASISDSNDVYKYILIVLDVFSRFCFMCALQSKSSNEVASRLIKTFSDTGPPLRIQSDQGPEFKGSVELLMNAMKVKIIHSRPYHPQAQGKVGVAIFA